MTYNLLYNEIRMSRAVVREIMDYIPEKEVVYTEMVYVFTTGDNYVSMDSVVRLSQCERVPYKRWWVTQTHYYKLFLFNDCLKYLTNMNAMEHLEIQRLEISARRKTELQMIEIEMDIDKKKELQQKLNKKTQKKNNQYKNQRRQKKERRILKFKTKKCE